MLAAQHSLLNGDVLACGTAGFNSFQMANNIRSWVRFLDMIAWQNLEYMSEMATHTHTHMQPRVPARRIDECSQTPAESSEKLLEKPPERPLDKLPERPLEKPPERLLEKTPQRPLERPLETPRERRAGLQQSSHMAWTVRQDAVLTKGSSTHRLRQPLSTSV